MKEKFYIGFFGGAVEGAFYLRGNEGSIAIYLYRLLGKGWGLVETNAEEFDQFDEDKIETFDKNEATVNLTVVYKFKNVKEEI